MGRHQILTIPFRLSVGEKKMVFHTGKCVTHGESTGEKMDTLVLHSGLLPLKKCVTGLCQVFSPLQNLTISTHVTKMVQTVTKFGTSLYRGLRCETYIPSRAL